MRIIQGLLISALTILLCGCSLLQDRQGSSSTFTPPQGVDVPLIGAAPTIDGDVSDPVWREAAVCENFLLYNKLEPAQVQTRGLMACDENGIYVAFICNEPQTDELVARARLRDDPISHDDCVELFVRPGNHDNQYVRFAVNSLGTQQDQRSRVDEEGVRTQNYDWNGDWRAAAKVTPGEGWTVEMAIPWHDFSADMGPGPWTFNISRGRRAGEAEFSSFSFADGSFHNLDGFAPLRLADVNLTAYGGYDVTDVRVKKYLVAPRGYAYIVQGTVSSSRQDTQRLRLRVEDVPEEGEAGRGELAIELQPGEAKAFEVKALAPSLGYRGLAVRLCEADSGRTVYLTGFPRTVFPSILSARFDHKCYVAEQEGSGLFELALPVGDREYTAALEIRLPDGRTVSGTSRFERSQNTAVRFPMKDVPRGFHPARFTVTDADGGVIGEHVRVIWRDGAPEPAPAPAADEQGEPVRVGWASADVSPDRPVLLRGQRFQRICPPDKQHDPVTTTALAIESQSGEQAILVSADICLGDDLITDLREALRGRAAGLDLKKILLSATHTHTAPMTTKSMTAPEGVMLPAEYRAFLVDRMADVVVEAWNSRRPGAVSRARGHAQVGFCRIMTFEGGRAEMYADPFQPAFTGFEAGYDHRVETLYFWDLEGKLTGVLVNVACPSQVVEMKSEMSADYWHEARKELRRMPGFPSNLFVLPMCSAAGDQSPRNYADPDLTLEEQIGYTGQVKMGVRVAEAVADALPRAKARIYSRLTLGHEVTEVELTKKEEIGGTLPVELHAIRIGDAAIVNNPFELYLDYGLDIRRRSPAAQTFIAQLAGNPEGYGGYLPTEEAVRGGAYGSTLANGVVGPQGGKELVEHTLLLLSRLYGMEAGQ